MIDRRQFNCGLAAAGIVSLQTPGLAAGSRNATHFAVHEPTEIAWIMAALSPLGRKDGSSIRRDTSYFARLERWFAPHAMHPAVLALGSDFNLPRLVGNAADYSFDADERLIKASGAAPLWDDADGDLFARLRTNIEDFSRVSRARQFLRGESGTFRASYEALEASVDIADITNWLESQFPERPPPVQLLVSPLTGGWNWTNLGGPRPRVWVPEPKSVADADPVARFITVASVFTEVDHIYVNPVTQTLMQSVETVFAKDRRWATDSAWADYDSGELVFNEYMTWSVFLEYARERMSSMDYELLAAKIVRFMEEGRGFIRFAEFAAVVHRLRAPDRMVFHEAFAAIITRCDEASR